MYRDWSWITVRPTPAGSSPAATARLRFASSMTATVLAPDWRRTSRTTVGTPFKPGRGALLPGPVLRPADVPDADGRAADRGDHQVVEGAGVGQAADRPERRLPGAPGHVAPGGVGVLPDDRVAHVRDRDPEGGQPVRLDPHVDRALQPADDPHLAHARRPLEADLHHLVRQLGQLAEGPVAGQGHRQDRLLVVVELRNRGAASRPPAGP